MPSDIFISYRRKDSERVLPLVQALRDEGISPWLDQSEIDEFAAITDAIRQGLFGSKALIAWYSADYPKSRPCQMELTAAFIAAQHEGDPRRRVLVINPEGAPTHIEPIELRDVQYAAAQADGAGYAALAKRIKAHLATLATPLRAILPIAPPSQYGLKLAGASRFVGRLPELWRIHSALHERESAIISGTSGVALAQVSGLGGIGKSLLAEEYALRFGAAYSGGIFWLRAFGNDPTRTTASAEAREMVRVEEFGAVATAMGIDIKGLEPAQVEALLGAKLSQQGKPFLWIVDDLGTGWGETIRGWLAPSPLGKTLVTTRSREYSAIGTALPLDVLTAPEAFELLCARRKPMGPDEESAARGIAADLGYHALAVDVTGSALEAQVGLVSFSQFREALANPTEDELDLAAELTYMLPSGHEKSVGATLLRSVRSLSAEGQDFLRLASLLAVAPIPPALVAATFSRVNGLKEKAARRRAADALAAVEKASLAERAEGDARRVHILVSRTIRFHDAAPERIAALRGAVVTSLAEALVKDSDICARTQLAVVVQHARALCTGQLPDAASVILAARLAHHDYERGLYVAARDLLDRVLATRRRMLGDKHPDTLTSMIDLAETIFEQGELAGARDLEERVLATRRRVLGDEHPDTLKSMANLAVTLSRQGELAGARDLEERVLATRRRVLGDEHPDTLTSMANLAVTLSRQGELAGARDLEERVLAMRRRVLGDEHPDTLTSMANLAVTLSGQGDIAGARDLEERVLATRVRVLGDEHPNTLTSMANLAETLSRQGDIAGACDLHRQVLAAFRRVLGDEHTDTTVAAWNLVGNLLANQQAEAAKDVFDMCLAWLLAADDEILSADQRTVKESILEKIHPSRKPTLFTRLTGWLRHP